MFSGKVRDAQFNAAELVSAGKDQELVQRELWS
jgi:hypothetical protein